MPGLEANGELWSTGRVAPVSFPRSRDGFACSAPPANPALPGFVGVKFLLAARLAASSLTAAVRLIFGVGILLGEWVGNFLVRAAVVVREEEVTCCAREATGLPFSKTVAFCAIVNGRNGVCLEAKVFPGDLPSVASPSAVLGRTAVVVFRGVPEVETILDCEELDVIGRGLPGVILV